MACISRFAAAISSGETELALGTIRVKKEFYINKHIEKCYTTYNKKATNYNITAVR